MTTTALRKNVMAKPPCTTQIWCSTSSRIIFNEAKHPGITNPDNFVSLLYYFGMLTISGMYEGKTKLTIPNQVVREQIYTYLLSTYDEAELSFSSYEKNELTSALAYDGSWKAYFGYIANCLKRYTSQRAKQKGEFFVHGFTLAMTAQLHKIVVVYKGMDMPVCEEI